MDYFALTNSMHFQLVEDELLENRHDSELKFAFKFQHYYTGYFRWPWQYFTCLITINWYITQIAPKAFLCCPLGITTIFSNTIICVIRIFSRSVSSTGISSTDIVNSLAWNFTFNNFRMTCCANIFFAVK